MAGSATEFEKYIAEEIEKYRGIAVPVRAGLLERALVRSADPKILHPNPGDEFSMPEIGPNFEIISKYGKEVREAQSMKALPFMSDPVTVEKISPDGYMLLNGHHRWAACVKAGVKKMAIHITNVTHEDDIRSMLQETDNHMRVTLDLDEVVFSPADGAAEKARPFAIRPLERKPIRLGIPALFRFFRTQGYDVWVYTTQYYSMDDVECCFARRRAKVTGVVTGAGRKTLTDKASGNEVENMIADKYDVTIHIDNNMLLKTYRQTGEFEEYPLTGSGKDWSREIMGIVQGMKK